MHLAILAVLLALCCNAHAEVLPRRADLGTGISTTPDKGPEIVRFRPGSVLERAGLRIGDVITELATSRPARMAGDPLRDGEVFGSFFRSARAGDEVRIKVARPDAPEVHVKLPAMREEKVDGVDLVYGSARSEKGYRVLTITSRPKGATGKLPLVVFVPWLSCSPVENVFDGNDGWSKMLRAVMRDGGVQLVRIEKPGVSDSEGPDCSETDLDHDMAAFRAGIRAALADPGADASKLYLFGGSVGGALVPVLAREFKPRGIIATGGFTRTWYEHMLDIERRRLTFQGKAPPEVNAGMRALGGLYDRVLNRGQSPGQVLVEQASWKPYWEEENDRQYGRPTRYYRQLQALDVEGAWQDVTVPTLIVWGEFDWIMGRDESDRAAAILGDKATYVVRPRMNHHFDVFADRAAAFREEGGKYDEGAAEAMVHWLKARV